jgi:hypothetical protein
MKTTLKVLAVLFALSTAASAQVAPAATSASGVPASGRLYYAFRYAQSAEFGGVVGTWQTSTASATANYANGSVRAPLTLDYAGGYTWTLTGPNYGSGVFQHMYVTQGGVWRKWAVSLSDDVSYLPQTPITGFSGIPGIGEPIGTPNPDPSNSQTILSLNTHVVRNFAMGSVENKLSAATTLGGSGGYEMLRYPNNDGIDTDSYSATGEVTHRLDGRDSIAATYLYDSYSYPNYVPTFGTDEGLIGFKRLLSRKLSMNVAAGPLWVYSSNNQNVPLAERVPSNLTYAVNGRVDYTSKPTLVEVEYSHGVNGGAGYLLGATGDIVHGNFMYRFGPNVAFGMTAGYDRTAGLTNNGATDNVVGGTQATWQVSRNFIAFANYTGIYQTTTSSLASTAINQVLHTIGFGFGYSPRNTHLKQ